VLKWSRKELFWVVKHGFKMTGMPAFGLTYSDMEIGDIVAFITRPPDMTPQEYARLREDFGKEPSGGHRH
jgi:mono/diheme cytochrome c family protein